MKYEELKQKAADIRDETQDAANTAQRVGTVLIEMIEAGESVDNSIEEVQGTIPSAVGISEYDFSMSHEDENRLYAGAIIELKNSAGEVIAKDTMYGASDTYPGLMSMKKFKQVNAHEEAITALQQTVPSAINVSVYDYSMSHEDENVIYSSAIIELKNSAGEVIAKDTLFGAGDIKPGLMSMKKFKQVNAHEKAIADLQQTIKDLTARIEALEKGGGGGGSSADVEDGTLSASASVVNEVMSVQGSVKDGILKL